MKEKEVDEDGVVGDAKADAYTTAGAIAVAVIIVVVFLSKLL